jgi:iron complex outermembrane receptor protein
MAPASQAPPEGPINPPGEARMRVKTLILCSASTLFVLAGSPVLAQTAPPNAGQRADDNAAPQAGPADSATSGTPEASGDAIVVTGLRRSLQSAEQIKRSSDQIVDSVVASDIGKLPDVAVSDTAARIPGVQVLRGGGEASQVLVRGLPNFETTYNGREIFTAETRVVALQDFPSGAIGAIEVYKTSTANLVEPGLAGLINVRSHRPFDFSGLEAAGNFWEQYTEQSRVWHPNGNFLLSDRWSTGIGEIGALINFSYTELTYLDSTRSNTDFIANDGIGNGKSARFPDIDRVDYASGDRSRPSINGALQWRPKPGLEFYAEGLWQGFRNKISDRELEVPLWGGQSYTNVVLKPGTDLLQSATIVNPFRPDGFQGGTFNKTNTYQFAVGGNYSSGPLKISADVARTTSQFTGNTESVDYAFSHPVTVNATIDANGNGPQFSLPGFDASNPANYIYRGFYEERQIAKGKDWQARTDLEYETGISFLPKIEIGLRYVDRYAHRQYGNHYFGGDPVLNQNVPITAVPLDYELFQTGFRGDNTPVFHQWLAPTYQSIQNNILQLRAFSRALGDPANLGPPAPFPDQTYSASEKSYAAYAQVRYAFGNEAGIHVDGLIGIRPVKTNDTVQASTVTNGAYAPITITQHYTDWLPNVSADIHFTHEIQLRLSATKTRTRPDFAQIDPGGSVSAPPSNCIQNMSNCVRTLNSGNPDLQPMRSNNYDASLEYYFSRAGFASVAIFRRDIKDYIENFQTYVTNPDFGLVLATGPFNASKSRIDGVEAQFQSFLDVQSLPAWIRGFGVQANVTYLKTRLTLPQELGGFTMPIAGVSKWTANLSGMYERGGLSLRLSYNYRNKFLSLFRPDLPAYPDGVVGSRLYQEETQGIGRLDFSGSYDVLRDLTLFVDYTNILNSPFRTTESTNFVGGDTVIVPRSVQYQESVLSLGIRFRF